MMDCEPCHCLASISLKRSDDDEGQKVKLLCAFSDERWTGGRSITDLDWSPKVRLQRPLFQHKASTHVQFHELVVASYNKNHSAHNDPDGIVAVWNLHLVERPEFVFHSPVSQTMDAASLVTLMKSSLTFFPSPFRPTIPTLSLEGLTLVKFSCGTHAQSICQCSKPHYPLQAIPTQSTQ